MASAFDGIGMGMLGSEKRFMTGDNALADAFKGLKTGLTVKAIGESGLGDFLSGLTKKSVPPPTVQSMGGILGTTGSQGGVNPFEADSGQTAPVPDDDALHQEFNLNKISSQSFTTPDVLTARNSSQDQIPMQMASAPPPQVNLPQYGKQSGGGGASALSALASLATLFV